MRTLVPDESTYISLAREHAHARARLPIVIERELDGLTPAALFAAVRASHGGALLLESGKAGRYSYVCIPTHLRFTSSGRRMTLPDGSTIDGDPFEELRVLLAHESVGEHEMLANFRGGWVGYLSYDMARHVERLPELAVADPVIPDCELVLVETFCEIDHEHARLRLVTVPRVGDDAVETYRASLDALDRLAAAIRDAREEPEPFLEPGDDEPVANMSAARFEEIVRRAKEYIRAGDIFQVNLSVRFAKRWQHDPLALYRRLRRINPSPYMALIELPELAIVSASPELLVRVRDRVIETRPIAGTRPRGASDEEDERMARKLAENEKERAEHLMLVDLERNDIGRVARYGSVRVDEFMGIERYSHVIHIVSHVRGELAEGRDVIDAIRACFPGGTITGAPKVRSMEIIEELEPHRRGVYTGSIGWIGFDGSAELNIAIRTIVIVDGLAYAQAGAGIVADSVPEHEYRESLRKAQAAMEALGVVEWMSGGVRE